MTTAIGRLGVLLLLLCMVVCACGSAKTESTTTVAEVTTTVGASTSTVVGPSTTVALAGDDSTCIACHTDEETLKALAVEEGTGGETLSEGEG